MDIWFMNEAPLCQIITDQYFVDSEKKKITFHEKVIVSLASIHQICFLRVMISV